MNTRHLMLGLALAAGWPGMVLADASEAVPASADHWLSLQRGQVMASSQPQAASGLAREKAMERLFKTYDQPIPDKYFSDSFKSGQ